MEVFERSELPTSLVSSSIVLLLFRFLLSGLRSGLMRCGATERMKQGRNQYLNVRIVVHMRFLSWGMRPALRILVHMLEGFCRGKFARHSGRSDLTYA